MQKYSEISRFTLCLHHFAHAHPTLRITSRISLSKCARFSLLMWAGTTPLAGSKNTSQMKPLNQSTRKIGPLNQISTFIEVFIRINCILRYCIKV